ncbi:MAG: hypothetical protein WA061_00195 [Microgenomates group bacterium]
MDKKFWDTIGLILVFSNAAGIFVLFEMLILKFPFITLFFFIFYCVWEVNKKILIQKPKEKILNPKS